MILPFLFTDIVGPPAGPGLTLKEVEEKLKELQEETIKVKELVGIKVAATEALIAEGLLRLKSTPAIILPLEAKIKEFNIPTFRVGITYLVENIGGTEIGGLLVKGAVAGAGMTFVIVNGGPEKLTLVHNEPGVPGGAKFIFGAGAPIALNQNQTLMVMAINGNLHDIAKST